MIHLRLFENETAFDSAKDSLVTPYVTYIKENKGLYYKNRNTENNDEETTPPQEETTPPQDDANTLTKWYLNGELVQESDIVGEYTRQEIDFDRVEIGSHVTSIGNGAFWECSSLTSITIPDSVTSIDDSAFYSCNGLTSIDIPNSVTSIGIAAFYNCVSLTSITIPNSMTSISDETFQGCYGLTSITIPDSVTSISRNALAYCYDIPYTIYLDSESQIDILFSSFYSEQYNGIQIYVNGEYYTTFNIDESSYYKADNNGNEE